MTYSPVEIRHIQLRRALRGYRRSQVDELLREVADSYEAVWRERAELLDRVDQLDSELARQKEVESLLRTTLVSAQRAAQDLREQARREAKALVEEAQLEARAITRDARATREALALESRRIRALLRAALELIEDGQGVGGPTPASEAA